LLSGKEKPLAQKILDMVQFLLAEQDLDELMEALTDPEEAGAIIDFLNRSDTAHEPLPRSMNEYDRERLRGLVGELLVQGLGYNRSDVYALLYTEGQPIVWH